MAEDLA